MIHVARYPQGPRCWLFGQRVHHGAVGVALAVALRNRRALLAGALLCAHDRHDWRYWFARERLHELSAR